MLRRRSGGRGNLASCRALTEEARLDWTDLLTKSLLAEVSCVAMWQATLPFHKILNVKNMGADWHRHVAHRHMPMLRVQCLHFDNERAGAYK